MQEQWSNRQLHNSMLKALDSLNLLYLLIEPISGEDGKLSDFKFTEANQAVERLFRRSRREIIGKTRKQLLGADVNGEDRNLEVLGKTAETGEPAHFETLSVHGKTLDVYAWKIEGKIAIVATDITERKKTEETRLENERLYKTVFEQNQDAFELFEVICDENGKAVDERILRVNQAFEKLTGIKAADILGRTVKQLNPTVDPSYFGLVDKVLKTSTGIHTECYHDYEKRYFDAYYFPYSEKIVGLLYRDITEHKKAEEALKESEEHYRQLFDSITEMFFVAELARDENGKAVDIVYTEANSAFAKTVQLPREQIIGRAAKEIYGGSFEDRWIQALEEILATATPTHKEEHSKRIGRYYDVYAWKASSNSVGVIVQDVSHSKAMETELRNKEHLAAIGQTAGMVGHDIRNPLQAILGDVYLLKGYLDSVPETPLKNDVSESLDAIEKNIGYINKIVADLQDYARPLKPDYSAVDISEVMTNVVKNTDFPSNIKIDVASNTFKKFKTDPTFIRRMLTNLVNNAIQAMPDGGDLSLACFLEEDKLRITVTDTGVGIPEHFKSKVFSPMMTTKSKGQGLGLAVVKRLVEALNGTINFESREGKGTKFIIELPN